MGDYDHRIEYKRRQPGGALVCEHVENVSDHGWYVVEGVAWREHYTRGCAAEYLDRVRAKAGTYVVVVWRSDVRVCTTKLTWNLPPSRVNEVIHQ
ncbi:MAG TPA: hypothetical protein VNO31_00170 [Umezawaea sp.]|jgi:hypothetical protein|nr:hypothetical protein [Umezawaea sp.]